VPIRKRLHERSTTIDRDDLCVVSIKGVFFFLSSPETVRFKALCSSTPSRRYARVKGNARTGRHDSLSNTNDDANGCEDLSADRSSACSALTMETVPQCVGYTG
jgi:hypothetical protein